MVGNGLGGIVNPILLRATISRYGYPWAVRILGFVFVACLSIGNFLIRPRLAPKPKNEEEKVISLDLFRKPGFVLLTVVTFCIETTYFGALGILPTYATHGSKFPPETGFYVIAVLSAGSCFGRVIPGILSDKIGRFNMLGVMMSLTLVFMVTTWLPFGHSSLGILYLTAVLFGFGTGSWIAGIPACLGQISGAHEFGRYWGTLYLVASFATLISVPIDGALIDLAGPQPMVGFMCAVTGVGICAVALSRWALLDWQWSWKAVV